MCCWSVNLPFVFLKIIIPSPSKKLDLVDLSFLLLPPPHSRPFHQSCCYQQAQCFVIPVLLLLWGNDWQVHPHTQSSQCGAATVLLSFWKIKNLGFWEGLWPATYFLVLSISEWIFNSIPRLLEEVKPWMCMVGAVCIHSSRQAPFPLLRGRMDAQDVCSYEAIDSDQPKGLSRGSPYLMYGLLL